MKHYLAIKDDSLLYIFKWRKNKQLTKMYVNMIWYW